MAKEIERKFLLKGEEWRPAAARCRRMRQGYLAKGVGISVRVRVSGDDAWLSVKCGDLAASRDEYEYRIPIPDAQELLACCEQPLIEKVRHWVPFGDLEWEVDEFFGANAGLLVAEIELDHEEQRFPLPPWVGNEVTHLPRYYNVNLVAHPYQRWSALERQG